LSREIDHALDLFELFAEHCRPLNISEMALALKLPTSGCSSIVELLVARGFLTEVAPTVGYYPTRRLVALTESIMIHDPIIEPLRPALSALRDKLGETVSLGKITGPHAGIHLMVLRSPNPLHFHNTPGSPVRHLHATSAGKVILGELSPDDFTKWLDKAVLTRITPKTLVSKPKLRSIVERGRERGWYLNDRETLLEVTTIGTSFKRDSVRYFITVAGPTERIGSNLQNCVDEMLRTSKSLDDDHTAP
jgi:DNA-binding IclR family transcriptional regulator